jgi:hypothetical protein
VRRYVGKNRKPQPAPPLPKGEYRGEDFVDADGTQFSVVWVGHRDSPSLCGDLWQNPHGQEPRLALRRPR